jgi:hypothetical protein
VKLDLTTIRIVKTHTRPGKTVIYRTYTFDLNQFGTSAPCLRKPSLLTIPRTIDDNL